MSAAGMKSLRSAWHRMRDAAAALIPASLREKLTGDAPIVAIDVADDGAVIRRFADGRVIEIARLPREAFDAAGLRSTLSAHLAKPWFLRDAVALRLPDAVALRRPLALPLAARRNIDSLLDIELERQSPLDRDAVYHDYRILGVDSASSRIDIVWRIVRRSTLAPALDICRRAGIDLAVIAFTGDDVLPDGGNFPVAPRAALLLRLRRWLVRGLLLLILVLLLAVAAGAYTRNQQALDDFAGRVDIARHEARASLHLEHDILATRARASALLHERQHLGVTRILAEVTRLLPAGSWLNELSYRDGEVHLRGTSNAASSLIALFDASPLFTAAEFRAPLVQGQGREQEQFDLAFKIREAAR
jgi:general secretion pathway protein L